MKKILLVGGPFYRLFKNSYSISRYPLSLGYLAGTIKKETSWDVMAYNADFYPDGEAPSIGHLVGEGFDNYISSLKDYSRSIWKEIKSTIEAY
ncbi:MAG: hypothetical protein HQ542_01000, partial [Bacteroidia bacterium]|nr:hypothetical protein [Bacteroidia bacterium]